MIYIYKIENLVNKKFYIGSTSNYKNRWNHHKNSLKRGLHKNPILQNSWNKYGEESFEFTILEEFSDKSIQYQVEQSYMDNLKPFYNIAPFARGGGSEATKGKNHWKNKINEEKAKEIKLLLAKGVSNKVISAQVKVKSGMVMSIKKGYTWSYVLPELNDKIAEFVQSSNVYTLQEKETIKLKIIELFHKNVTRKNISKQLNVKMHLVDRLISEYIAEKEGKLFNCCECNKQTIKRSSNHKYCSKCAKKIQKQHSKNNYIKSKS